MIQSKQQTEKSLKNLDLKQDGVNSKLIISSLIATLIAITPYLFYLHESVPDTKIWNTFLFTYDSKAWEDANYVMWIATGKAIPLLLLFIWFFTCRHWWYHVVLVPIAMYSYQIFGIFIQDQEKNYIDEFPFLYLVPLMAIIIPSIYLIRAKMFNKINDADKTMEELEEEFKIKPKSIFGKLSNYF